MNRDPTIKGDLDGILSSYLARKRMEAVKDYLEGCRRILDVGCGVFRWQDRIPPHSEYVGLDREEEIIDYNREHYPHKFFCVDVDSGELDISGIDFDLIIILAVIEHLPKPENMLRRLSTLLAPGGLIVLTTPHPFGERILEVGALVRLFSRDKHQHQALFNQDQIENLARNVGCRLKEYSRFMFGFNQLVVLERNTKS